MRFYRGNHRFYRGVDPNDPVFDINTAILLGEDSTPLNGFSLAVNTGTPAFGFVLGNNRIFAVAIDSDGGMSVAATTLA